MVTVQGDVSRARYQSRPGRRAVVVASLAELRGPAEGTVELPLWLFWYPDRAFDLDDPACAVAVPDRAAGSGPARRT